MSEHTVIVLASILALTWVAVTLIRCFGIFGLIAVCAGFLVVWPTIERLLK